MGQRRDCSGFQCGMVAGAKWMGLSSLESAEFLGLFDLYRWHRMEANKQNKYNKTFS